MKASTITGADKRPVVTCQNLPEGALAELFADEHKLTALLKYHLTPAGVAAAGVASSRTLTPNKTGIVAAYDQRHFAGEERRGRPTLLASSDGCDGSIATHQHVLLYGGLWCDAEVVRRVAAGTTIGMNSIKQRRLIELALSSHPGLHAGDCVPFYFCPRSVMLYLPYQGNHPELGYRGGQGPIIHLEADLNGVVAWTNQEGRRWASTLSNAGSRFFEDRNDLAHLSEIDWNEVQARDWRQCKKGKQAEFLLEHGFPWNLVEQIGVYSRAIYQRVANAMPTNGHRPPVAIRTDCYY